MNFLNFDNLKRESVCMCYIHNGEQITPGFTRSMLEFQAVDNENRHIIKAFGDAASPFHEWNRNAVVTTILTADEAEWSMWIDTDITFKPEDVYSLMTQAHPTDRPIISGLYFGYPVDQTIQPYWYEEHEDGKNLKLVEHLYGEPLQPIKGAGMGFCLIHTSVFKAMPERPVTVDGISGFDPWRWFGKDLWVRSDNHKVDRLGEDITFFKRIWKEVTWNGAKGVPVYGHRGVTVKHRKAREIDVEVFLSELKERQERAIARSGNSPGTPRLGTGGGGAAAILDPSGNVVGSNHIRH